jgi:hypothetical protein
LQEAEHSYINVRLNNIKKGIKNNQKSLDEIRTLIIKRTTLVEDLGLSTSTYKVYDLPNNYNYLLSDIVLLRIV